MDRIKKNRIIIKMTVVMLFATLLFAGGMAYKESPGVRSALSFSSGEAHAMDVYTGNPIVKIVKDSSPAVVNIDTETMVTRTRFGGFPFDGDPFFEEFFGQIMPREPRQQQVPRRGKGSGFIVSQEGYVLTNNHVIDGADNVKVTLMDGRNFDAEIVGQDPTFDLAVIKIKASSLPVLQLGDSDATEVGEWVVAIGNPLGFENSVTAGVVSAKNRTLQAPGINFQGFLQTDASINPGNSGGPLIDLNGRVVGINTAIVPYAQGIGFAVPINMAKQVMDDLIRHGEVRRGWLGVTVQQLTASLVEAYKIPVKEGAIIADVNADGPADKAGLQRGDVIIGIGGQDVKNSQDVVFLIRNKMQGDKVPIEIYRDGKKRTINVTLGEIEGGKRAANAKDTEGSSSGKSPKTSTHIGITVSEITKEAQDRYKLKGKEGLIVTDVERGSQGQRLGLQPGDVILEVNKEKMNRIVDWDRMMGKNNKALGFLISRGGATLFISVQM